MSTIRKTHSTRSLLSRVTFLSILVATALTTLIVLEEPAQAWSLRQVNIFTAMKGVGNSNASKRDLVRQYEAAGLGDAYQLDQDYAAYLRGLSDRRSQAISGRNIDESRLAEIEKRIASREPRQPGELDRLAEERRQLIGRRDNARHESEAVERGFRGGSYAAGAGTLATKEQGPELPAVSGIRGIQEVPAASQKPAARPAAQ